MERKKQIKQQTLWAREKLSHKEVMEKSRRITERVFADSGYQKSESVLIYMDFRNEAATGGIITGALREGKRVYVPKVESAGEMVFYEINSLNDTVSGFWGIREPLPSKERKFPAEEGRFAKSIVVMPGAAFDKKRHRIGYGGGYYDRFLAGKEGINTIALCFDCQMLEAVPFTEFDYIPDVLYTESSVY